jgi:hypothetical protein
MTKQLQKNCLKEYQYIPLDNNEEYFYTYDLGCSSALISAGFELISLDKANPQKVQFIFHRKIGIERVVNDYWADCLEIKARTFFDNIKMLKNRIYSE